MIINIIIALLVFCLIVSIHEFGHFLLAKINKVGVIEYSIGFGPKIFKHKWGETIYSIGIIPFGGYCSMVGEDTPEDSEFEKDRSFAEKNLLQRFSIVAAGPIFNFLLAFICGIIYITVFGSPNVASINDVVENSPAYEAGLQANDVIVSINDRTINTFTDVTAYNITHGGETFNVVVERDGEQLTYEVVPTLNEETQTYAMGILLDSQYIMEGRSFTSILKSTFYELRYWTRLVFDSFRMIGRGTASVSDMTGVIGVVGIMGDSVGEARSYGLYYVVNVCLYMIIFLSMNLGIMNLLPFPALDGGRCFLFIVEGITKKTIPRKVEVVINNVGFAALMLVMVVVMFNDIVRIFA